MRLWHTVLIGCTVVCGLSLAGTPATADPSGKVPRGTDLVGVGSDTSESLFDQISADYHGHRLYSFRSTGSSTITTKRGCAPIARPNASTPGITALANRQVLANGRPCIDFARSVEPRPPSAPANLAFVPFALDGLTWATNVRTNAPDMLSLDQLRAMIECTATTWDQVGGRGTDPIQVFLPHAGPGILGFLQRIGGITQVGSCVTFDMPQDQGTDPQLAGNPNAVVFYSIDKFIGQAVYHHDDVHGRLRLHGLAGVLPTVYDPATRHVELN